MSNFFGKNLSYLRSAFNMSQTELSESVSINRTTISDYERGRSEPSLTKLKAIADKFNIPADMLLGDTIQLMEYVNKLRKREEYLSYGDGSHMLALDYSAEYSKNTKESNDKERIIAAQEQTIHSLSTTIAVLMDRIKDLEGQLRSHE